MISDAKIKVLFDICKSFREKSGWRVPSKYIEFRNRDEQIDFDTKMRQLQTEMHDLLQQEEASKQELKALFEKLGYSL